MLLRYASGGEDVLDVHVRVIRHLCSVYSRLEELCGSSPHGQCCGAAEGACFITDGLLLRPVGSCNVRRKTLRSSRS